jgi:hypothetical protein
MVNYHNPVTITQDFSACPFLSGFRGWQPVDWLVPSTAGVVRFWHLVNGIFMWVAAGVFFRASLPSRPYLTTQLDPRFY